MILECVKIEAHATSESILKGLFFAITTNTLGIIDNKLELDNFFCLELVLHEVPVGDPTITRDRVKV